MQAGYRNQRIFGEISVKVSKKYLISWRNEFKDIVKNTKIPSYSDDLFFFIHSIPGPSIDRLSKGLKRTIVVFETRSKIVRNTNEKYDSWYALYIY